MKLLNRTLLSFLIYSVIVLVVVTPVFYWAVNRMITQEVDEALLRQKQEIQSRISKIKSEDELKQWEDLDGDVKIEPTQTIIKDSLYVSNQLNSVSREQEPYRVLRAPLVFQQKTYRLTARMSLLESEDLIQAIVAAQFFVLITLLTGMLIIHWRTSRKIWQPFYRTLEGLKKFELEKNSPVHFDPSFVQEFNDLNRAIYQLISRDQAVYLQQKEFTENAAHEMQTPLAIFQSKLEMLLQTTPTPEQAALLESMLNATYRLTKLNKTLLLLAKIEGRQFAESEPVVLHEVVTKCILMYRAEAEEKEITVVADYKNKLSVFFNPTLLDIVVSNLLANAIRHSTRGSRVNVTIERDRLEVANPGEALSFPKEKIFNRFQKGNNHPHSTGLGLALVNKIAEVNGLKVTYHFENNLHIFCFDFSRSKISTK